MYRKRQKIMILLVVFLPVCVIGSFLLGRYPVPVGELFGILGQKLGIPVTPFWTAQMESAVWNIRLPRILLSVLVGAGLSAAGAGYQAVFQNPMASPDLLGASAGAGFGAALAILLGASGMGITVGAFACGLVTVALVFTVSRRAKGDRLLGLVLAGIMVSSLFQAGTSFLKLVADPNEQLPQITYWLMGSLSGADWADVGFAVIPMAVGMIPLYLLRWRLNVLTMGDDEARTMGVDPGKLRLWVVVCGTLVTASAVSVSGLIGWVGLVIPHMMRRLVGSEHRMLMPASMAGGGLFLLLADNVSRNTGAVGIPIGILTAFIGAPFFLWMITGKGDHHGH